MQSLFLDRVGSLSLRETAIPSPGPGEVIVKVVAATTCGTDLKAFRRGHPQIPMPGPFGHEYSGIVERVGEGARFKPGDAVMGVHSAPCQKCLWCLCNQENLCESIMQTKVLGSFAEYLCIPERIARLNLFPKPSPISFEVASLLEPLACVAQGILEFEKAGLLPREEVLVIGPGAIGLMFVAALRAKGVGKVTLAGRNRERLAVGSLLGSDSILLADLEPSGSFDLVVECTGQPEVWERSVDLPRRGGTVMLFGGCPSGTRVSFDTARLHYDQISLFSPFHFGTRAVRLAADLLTKIDLAALISGERRLDQAEETFGDLIAGRGIKYAFKP